MCNLYYSEQPERTSCVPETKACTMVRETSPCVNIRPSENAFQLLTWDPGNLPSSQTLCGAFSNSHPLMWLPCHGWRPVRRKGWEVGWPAPMEGRVNPRIPLGSGSLPTSSKCHRDRTAACMLCPFEVSWDLETMANRFEVLKNGSLLKRNGTFHLFFS